MATTRLGALVSALSKKTEDRSIKWEDDFVLTGLSVNINSNKIRIIADDKNYYLKIYNSDEQEIESYHAGVMLSIEDPGQYDKMKNLYKLAKSNAYKIDETIDEILQFLTDDELD